MLVSRTARVFLAITLGVAAAFLLFWLAALAQPGTTLYFGGELVPRWAWYLGIVEWYGLMAYVLGTVWVFTKDSRFRANGRPARFGSTRLNRLLLVSLPFFAVGTVIGKSSDALKQAVGLFSFTATALIPAAFIAEDIRIRYRERHRAGDVGSSDGTEH